MFDSPVLIALISIAGTAIVGGGGVLGYVLYKRKHTADAVGAELKNEETEISLSIERKDAFRELKNAVNEMVSEQLENQRKIMKVEQEKQSLNLMLQIEKSKNEDIQKNLNNILIEQGAAQERERQCQQNLREIKTELSVLKQQQQPV